VKLALISDLHANYEALQAVAEDVVEADVVACAGDLLGYYCQVNETLEWVRANVDYCVLGNHDHYVLNGCPDSAPPAVRFGVEFARRNIDPQHFDWLGHLSLTTEFSAGGKSFYLVHGSPWSPLEDYLYVDSPKIEELFAMSPDVIAFGQTHRFFSRNIGGRLRLNPGSVGQSRDPHTSGDACAVVLDTATLEVTRVVRPYDNSSVERLAREHGAGEWIQKFMRK
jgi:putative phosphoesterase